MEGILVLIIGVIVMVIVNLILDKFYDAFPLLQMIISSAFFIGSFVLIINDYENGIAYGVLQFLGFYNLFTNVRAEEWTTREGRGYVDSFDTFHYSERDVNHYRPGWFNKLISCLIFTGIACLISLLVKTWWACLIPMVFEVLFAFGTWQNKIKP